MSAFVNIQKKYIRAEETDYLDKKRGGGALSAQVGKQALGGEGDSSPLTWGGTSQESASLQRHEGRGRGQAGVLCDVQDRVTTQEEWRRWRTGGF